MTAGLLFSAQDSRPSSDGLGCSSGQPGSGSGGRPVKNAQASGDSQSSVSESPPRFLGVEIGAVARGGRVRPRPGGVGARSRSRSRSRGPPRGSKAPASTRWAAAASLRGRHARRMAFRRGLTNFARLPRHSGTTDVWDAQALAEACRSGVYRVIKQSPGRRTSAPLQPARSIQSPHPPSKSPTTRSVNRWAGNNFSSSTNAVSTAIHQIFITPVTNRSAMRRAQQPTQ